MRRDAEDIKGLIQRCLAGEAAAWDELVKKVSPLILYITEQKLRRLGSFYQLSDLETLKQDILLTIWQKGGLESVKDIDKVIPWICAISANAAANHARKSRIYGLPRTSPLDETINIYSSSPPEILFEKELQDDIDAALKSLNDRENLIIKLHELYGKRYREISGILNIPIGTVLASAARAKVKMRKRLRKYRRGG
jgi:RNA polymerase sigma-70 factor (ECF subfamily)